MEKQNKIFWSKTGECFSGLGFGEDITEYFYDDDGNCRNVDRLKKLAEEGKICYEKPYTFEIAEEKELNQLRDSVNEKNCEIADLQDRISGIPINLIKAREEIKNLKMKLSIAQDEVKILKAGPPGVVPSFNKGGKKND